MLWLTGIGCLIVGIAIGYIVAGRINTNPNKLAELEQKLQDLQRNHAHYRDEVSDHFSTTAELVQQMTDSYKDVYQHLASGAQDLCSTDVASKLLPTSTDGVFGAISQDEDESGSTSGGSDTVKKDDLQAPKDYAPRQDPNQAGALAEDFGLEKVKEAEKE